MHYQDVKCLYYILNSHSLYYIHLLITFEVFIAFKLLLKGGGVMRLYLFVWPKSLLIVNYIIMSLYSMVNVKLEYFHCITYDSIFVVWWLFKNLMEWPRDCCVYIREYSSNRNRTSRCFLLLAFSSIFNKLYIYRLIWDGHESHSYHSRLKSSTLQLPRWFGFLCYWTELLRT